MPQWCSPSLCVCSVSQCVYRLYFEQMIVIQTMMISNISTQHGETAILIAVWHGFPKIVHILGEIGADTNIRNKVRKATTLS